MQAPTYSFKDTSGGFAHPLAGNYSFAGQIGAGRFVITMHTDRSVIDTAADGLILPSAVAGNSGTLSVEVQQTSPLHAFLLEWFNLIKSAFDNNDVSNWANANILLVNNVDGSQHQCSGVMPTKVPTKTYGPQAERLTWELLCCNIENTTNQGN